MESSNGTDRAKWDEDAMRDELRGYVCEALADPQAILILDETGFLKKGTKSVGGKLQYSGTAGRIKNCQIGVFLAYASRNGHALIDRELYLPKSWTQDSEHCRAAHVPEDRTFATKHALALCMLQRAWDAGISVAWVTGDTVYGGNPQLRAALEARRQAYALVLSGLKQHLGTESGCCYASPEKRFEREASIHELSFLCRIHDQKASEENRTGLCNLLLFDVSTYLQ